MTKFLAALSGFGLTALIFAGGVYTAILFVTAEPGADRMPKAGAAMASADEVVPISRNDKAPDAAVASPAEPKAEGSQSGPAQLAEANGGTPDADPGIDAMTTASFAGDPTAPDDAGGQPAQLGARHIAWCSQHYRSYDPSDNRYNAYSGDRPECVSPFSGTDRDEGEGRVIEASNDGSSGFVTAAQAGEMPAAMNPRHIEECFARYRSYRPSDNSYQPYGGGPRQQCE